MCVCVCVYVYVSVEWVKDEHSKWKEGESGRAKLPTHVACLDTKVTHKDTHIDHAHIDTLPLL